VAVLGCAAAFYFSDPDTSSKRKKQHPIHTKNFDDDLDSYDGDFMSSTKRRKKHSKRGGGVAEEDDDDDDEDEVDDDDEELDEDEEDEEDEEVDEDDGEDENEGDRYLVNKKTRKSKNVKPIRR
jgi:hypothetical protein